MEIIINETGKRYNLTMHKWSGSDWVQDMAEDIIIDSSYHYDRDAEAWRMDGHEDNLRDYLQDWEQYNTDADRDAYDEDERARLRDERPRSYDLDEIRAEEISIITALRNPEKRELLLEVKNGKE